MDWQIFSGQLDLILDNVIVGSVFLVEESRTSGQRLSRKIRMETWKDLFIQRLGILCTPFPRGWDCLIDEYFG